MTSRSLTERVGQSLTKTRLIYAAPIGVLPVLVVVGFIIENDEPGDPTFGFVLGGLSVMMLVMMNVVPRIVAKASSSNPGPDPVERALGTFLTSRLIYSAMAESIAVFGLFSSVLTGNKIWLIGHTVVALTALALGFPRRASLLAILPPDTRTKLEQGSYV